MRAAAPLLLAALLMGCAGAPKTSEPATVGFLERAHEDVENDVRVRAAVPSAAETRALFGVPLYARGVQPVWLEIENGRDEPVSFVAVGVDPEYFTPIEVASLQSSKADESLMRRFLSQGMETRIEPGETRSGFVFTRLDEGTKTFNVDVVWKAGVTNLTFFIPVPGLKLDHHEVDWDNLYPPDQTVELSEQDLIAAIERQACCTTNKSGKGSGDPLNLIVIGDLDDVYYAFIRAGWDETETIHRSSLLKTMQSFFTGGEYRYSPVSGLYVFGRTQDIALQKARDNIHERNHLRLWMSPARFQGKPVWIGQISRDIGVRFARQTITTHKIDPDVDETREFLLEDLAYSQSLAKFGYAGGVGAASLEGQRSNLTGDPYFTDGYRLVLWVSSKPVDIADVEFVPWAEPSAHLDE
ncbi:MAG: LssY C-terminal domain-containing protein [Myxococcota bacterium]